MKKLKMTYLKAVTNLNNSSGASGDVGERIRKNGLVISPISTTAFKVIGLGVEYFAIMVLLRRSEY
jgi:hypothetical protein